MEENIFSVSLGRRDQSSQVEDCKFTADFSSSRDYSGYNTRSKILASP